MKIIAANQSNYIPWKGYFDIINDVDTFVFYDEVQYTKKDWRNRNLIKTPKGIIYLTIPVITKGRFYQKISETIISDKGWTKAHLNTIYQNYNRTRYFSEYFALFEKAYDKCSQMDYLCEVNYYFINLINSILGITTEIINSKDLELADDKVTRVTKMCKDLNAKKYIVGPSARSYLSHELFDNLNISLVFKDYSGYPEYFQRTEPFEHNVSVLDLIFNVGRKAPWFIWGWRKEHDIKVYTEFGGLA